jgi:hypothetical protein
MFVSCLEMDVTPAISVHQRSHHLRLAFKLQVYLNKLLGNINHNLLINTCIANYSMVLSGYDLLNKTLN